MTANDLPRLSKKNTQLALRTLAVAKLVKDRVSAAEKQARLYLAEKAMTPGDRLTVATDAGDEVATVSLGKPRSRGGWEIADPMAFARWCEAHGIDHHGKPSVEFPEWFTASQNIQAIVESHAGEIPDGLEDATTVGAPSVIVRQTPAQAANLLSEFTSSAALLDAANVIDEEG